MAARSRKRSIAVADTKSPAVTEDERLLPMTLYFIVNMMKIDEFEELGLRVGKIVAAEPVIGSDKLLKFSVDIGEDIPRQILSGVVGVYIPANLIGRNVLVAANIDPKIMASVESRGMLIGVEKDQKGNPRLFFLDEDLPAGMVVS
jgi:methionine--tRNA ligase beta chain